MWKWAIVGRALSMLVLLGAIAAPVVSAGSNVGNDFDSRVNTGSPRTTFPRNKQNEPAVGMAVNPVQPSIVAAGANDEIDNAPCTSSGCPFTAGITDNGIYFSMDGGISWTQPTHTGWSARTGTGQVGPIGTVPWFYEMGLEGDGDPALAFGPRPGPNGFSWSNGGRLYYGSLASDFPGSNLLQGAEAIAVARTDNPMAAAQGNKNAWMRPVIASRQLQPTTFSDKDAIWADNAASSRFFGTVYACWTSFRTSDSPIMVARSTDGGDTWSDPVLVFEAVPTLFTGPTACTIRTDSHGIVYVAWEQINTPSPSEQMMSRSFNGGVTFDAARTIATVHEVGAPDPIHFANQDPRYTFDGIGGARTFAGTSLDIANGAPNGDDATNQLAIGWSDGRQGLDREQSLVQISGDRGMTWTAPVSAQQAGDRPDFTAIAIAPNGSGVYLTYDAFLEPFRFTTATPRPMQGVVRHASLAANGQPGDFSTLHRGAIGDARASSENNLCCEFLGDYNFVSATREVGVAVWNDVRRAQVCGPINAYRASLITSSPKPAPDPLTACPPLFGNSDIFGGRYTP
jgi:hypothetical protein